MPIDITSTLREALAKLTAEKRHIERQAAAIHDAIRAVSGANGLAASGRRLAIRGGGRRRMTAAARTAVSARMKAYWAKRRAGKGRRKKGAA